jgi:hypothetical protein
VVGLQDEVGCDNPGFWMILEGRGVGWGATSKNRDHLSQLVCRNKRISFKIILQVCTSHVLLTPDELPQTRKCKHDLSCLP